MWVGKWLVYVLFVRFFLRYGALCPNETIIGEGLTNQWGQTGEVEAENWQQV